eukprot:CAMPEP_0197687996 /NCGR_PEP_ID=MMETSP1338-20131121/104765_1 /TAXON_ID=43686 ORGANISM="Pelagodinium beii, Strain RCC1491" /NCGR_SAMPLE_ID=MMETSP1338 /ASSEMBLY_ACC=CAM_ASM_000754 /LENGTH=48 /DNA_ID= /DNA_START= /DNA_END= /DNA_ORIENTATION=
MPRGGSRMKWLHKMAEPMDSASLGAQKRLQDLTRSRDQLKRQLAAAQA